MVNSHSLALQIKAGEIEVIDPQNILNKCLIFFAFPKSKSANFPIARSLAQAATAYGEQDVDGRTLYWAGFTNSTSDLEKAAELIRLAGGWAGSMTRINGKNVTRDSTVYFVISCYLQAIQCTNKSAHCHKVIDDPFHPRYDIASQAVKLYTNYLEPENKKDYEDVKQYVFPCKRMLEFSMFHPRFSFKKTHGVPPCDQIQAAAVEYGMSICPYFDATEFKEIDTRKIKIEDGLI